MVRFSHAEQAGRNSLFRRREAVVILVALAGILWVGLITYRQIEFDRELALATVARTNEARVQGFEQFVLRTIETADLATLHIEANLDDITREKNSASNEPVLRSPVIDAFVVHRRGAAPILSGDSSLTPAAIRALDTFSDSSQLDLTITPPIPDGRGGKQVAALRKLADGHGYVAVLMNTNRFTDFAQDIPFTNHDLISLIGLDGITRARRTGNVLSGGEPVKGLVMARQKANPNGTYVGPSVLDGIPRIFSHRRISKYGLFATSGTPLTIVNDRVASRQTFQILAALAGMLAIIAAAVAIIVANRRRHQRLIALEDSNSRLLEAQRIGSIGDWDYYPATDTLYWSENLCAMYGRNAGEEVSSLSDVERHLSPNDASMIEKEVQKVVRDGEIASWEFEGILADGSRSHRRVVAVPIRDREGSIIGIHGTDQDVSQLVQAQEMERRLSEIARLESVNSLAATLAHELNQPLGVAANYLSAVQRMIEADGSKVKIREYLAASQDQVHHLSEIINGARDLVTPGKIDLEQVDVEQAIESVMALLRGHAGHRGVNYEVDLAANVSRIWTSGAQLKQVLFNLAKNSLEAIPPDRDPYISFRGRRSDDRTSIRIDVADNGTGLDGADDPFAALNTTKATGLGLGLSLARTIVEAHGGKIWIESTSVEGTLVSFTIGERR